MQLSVLFCCTRDALVNSNIVRFQNARDAETQVYDATFGKS